MTAKETNKALGDRALVAGGEGEDRDVGRILWVDGDLATVAWRSGVRTQIPYSELVRV